MSHHRKRSQILLEHKQPPDLGPAIVIVGFILACGCVFGWITTGVVLATMFIIGWLGRNSKI